MKAMGLKSPAPIQSRLKHLQDKGYIFWQEGKARTLQLVSEVSNGIPGGSPAPIAGAQTLFSPEVQFDGFGAQVWSEATLQFTANNVSARLQFCVDGASDGRGATFSTNYMGIDDIRLIRVFDPADCLVRNSDDDGIPDVHEFLFSDNLSFSAVDGRLVTMNGLNS